MTNQPEFNSHVETTCWRCGQSFDAVAASPSGPTMPRLGDVTICVSCATPAIFTGNGIEQRQPTEVEMRLIGGMPLIQHARTLILDHIAQFN